MKNMTIATNVEHETIENMVDAYTLKSRFGASVILFIPRSELTPEDIATLQAMYSRSNRSIIKKLIDLLGQAKLDQTKDRVVGQTHKGYGHKSIGDLGHLLLCYEGVSMLAAKAIQDSQLYAGQEASTRYITFDKQPFLVPSTGGGVWRSVDIPYAPGSVIAEQLRAFYLSALPQVQKSLFDLYPWEEQPGSQIANDEEKQKAFGDYERAIKARAFDIIRGFLPAGCTTNLAWWTSISHAAEHLGWLRCHPLDEVKELALLSQKVLETVYPTSFLGREVYPEREGYKGDFYENFYYLSDPSLIDGAIARGVFTSQLNNFNLREWKKYIMERPKGVELPYQIGECGVVKYEALLDFASFRDQQRHRAVIQRQGLISSAYGFHDWYLDNLPGDELRNTASRLLTDLIQQINQLDVSVFDKQYLFPMGMKIPTRIVGPLGKVVYMIELRAQTTVHPTYHANAYDFSQKLSKHLCIELGVDSVPLYVNPNVGDFSWKRGSQTISVGGKAISDTD